MGLLAKLFNDASDAEFKLAQDLVGIAMADGEISDAERKVFDLVARRFIGVFLPDCKFSTTTVLGEVSSSPREPSSPSIEFKVTGKEILDPGWRVVREKAK